MVMAYIGSLIKSQGSPVHDMCWSRRVHITDHFS